MTPFEIIGVLAVAWWFAKQVLGDAGGAAANRLGGSRRGGRRGGRGRQLRPTRYGVRGYFGDAWDDAWRTANMRRVARRQARAARIAGGQPGRLGALRQRFGNWWRDAGGRRELHRDRDGTVTDTVTPTRLDQAWDRLMARRQARAARRAAGEPSRLDRLRQRLGMARRPAESDPQVITPPPAGEPSLPAADDTSAGPTRRLDGQPETEEDRRFFDLRESGYTGWIDQDGHPVPNVDQWISEQDQELVRRGVSGGRRPNTDPGTMPGSTPAPTPETGHPNGSATPDNSRHNGGSDMAEVTGLGSAISYAGAQEQAAAENVTEVESFIASLEANEVTGEAVEAAHLAAEQYQAAAANFGRARAALERHQQVGEAYNANPDAGSRQFVTADVGGGAADMDAYGAQLPERTLRSFGLGSDRPQGPSAF